MCSIATPRERASRRYSSTSQRGSTTAATPASSSPIRYEAQPRSSWVIWRKTMASGASVACRAMHRSPYGFWLADAGPVAPLPPLGGRVDADVVVVGGGYLGLWTAWFLAEAGAHVAPLAGDRCGHGPSGRNGGFVETLWDRLGELRELFGDAAALEVARASETAVDGIAAWCDAE